VYAVQTIIYPLAQFHKKLLNIYFPRCTVNSVAPSDESLSSSAGQKQPPQAQAGILRRAWCTTSSRTVSTGGRVGDGMAVNRYGGCVRALPCRRDGRLRAARAPKGPSGVPGGTIRADVARQPEATLEGTVPPPADAALPPPH
jgi:hypothetical protein